MVYKWCAVPECTSTSIKNPQKIFLSVPTNPKKRKLWLRLSRRNPRSISPQSNLFMCEDHFDVEKDTTNYLMYKMGFCQKIRLSDTAVPTKFHCQEDRRTRLSDPRPSRAVFLKRRKLELVAKCLQSATETKSFEKEPEELPKTRETITITDSIANEEKSVQNNKPARSSFRRGATKNSVTRAAEAGVSADAGGAQSQSGFEVKKEPGVGTVGFVCSHCHKINVKFRYVCVQCADFNLCARCEANMCHADHYVLRVPAGKTQSEVSSVLCAARLAVANALTVFNFNAPPEDNVSVKKEPADEAEETDSAEDTDSSDAMPLSVNKMEIEEEKFQTWTHSNKPRSSSQVVNRGPKSLGGSQVVPSAEDFILPHDVASIQTLPEPQPGHSTSLIITITPESSGHQTETSRKRSEIATKIKTEEICIEPTSSTYRKRKKAVVLEKLPTSQIETAPGNTVRHSSGSVSKILKTEHSDVCDMSTSVEVQVVSDMNASQSPKT